MLFLVLSGVMKVFRIFIILNSTGKGKLVDILSGQYDVCARVAGGSNAGHTIVAKVRKYHYHVKFSGEDVQIPPDSVWNPPSWHYMCYWQRRGGSYPQFN